MDFTTLVQSDIVPMSSPVGSQEGFAGNAFTSEDLRITGNDLAIQDFDAVRDWR